MLILFVITAFILLSMLPAESVPAKTVYSNDYIRVGLKRNFYGQSQIHFNNRNVAIGFAHGNKLYETDKLTSSSGFTVTPLQGTFAVLDEECSSYKSAATASRDINELYGLDAWPVLTGVDKRGKGKWNVYVPDYSTSWAERTVDMKVKKHTTKYMLKITGSHDFLCDCENAGANIQFAAVSGNGSGVKVLSLSGRHFRGRMEIGTFGSNSVSAVNVIMFEDYLYGVVPMEMSSSWPLEALKAQAVACRSFAVASQGFGPSGSIKSYPHLNDTTQYQSYGGYDRENSRSTKAVKETANMFVTYKNEVVRTYFFSTSGGATEAPEYLWGSKIAYLKSVPDIYETNPEKEPWRYNFSTDKVLSLVMGYAANQGVNLTGVNRIDITKVSPSGRAVEMKISGNGGSVILKKGQIRSAFGLPSNKFKVYGSEQDADTVNAVSDSGAFQPVRLKNAVVLSSSGERELTDTGIKAVMGDDNISHASLDKAEPGTFMFIGSGYGHGIGMSQSGARGMAEAGYDYKQILKHYFTKTEVN